MRSKKQCNQNTSIRIIVFQERSELAVRAMALEDDIFDVMNKLSATETAMISGQTPVDMNLVQELRDELNGLKDDYIILVGGSNDLPLYFGKVPDSLQ